MQVPLFLAAARPPAFLCSVQCFPTARTYPPVYDARLTEAAELLDGHRRSYYDGLARAAWLVSCCVFFYLLLPKQILLADGGPLVDSIRWSPILVGIVYPPFFPFFFFPLQPVSVFSPSLDPRTLLLGTLVF